MLPMKRISSKGREGFIRSGGEFSIPSKMLRWYQVLEVETVPTISLVLVMLSCSQELSHKSTNFINCKCKWVLFFCMDIWIVSDVCIKEKRSFI